jgi:hypothetical protein
MTFYITTCACGQKNRVPTSVATANCGRCKQPLAIKATLDNFADRLHAASRREDFGRMHFPQDYGDCPKCGTNHNLKKVGVCRAEK